MYDVQKIIISGHECLTDSRLVSVLDVPMYTATSYVYPVCGSGIPQSAGRDPKMGCRHGPPRWVGEKRQLLAFDISTWVH